MSLKRSLSARLRRVRASRDRGASAVLVAILLVPVLFGAMAISMDVGLVLWERRQVQNGADAAVLAAAGKCAESPSTCNPNISAGSSLTNLAGANATDGKTSITSVCGSSAARAVSASLALCVQPASPGVVDCPAVPSAATGYSYIELRTRTRTTGGDNFITSRVASALTGAAQETPVGACARAAWGPAAPSSLNVFPILMSYCDWKDQTGYNGTAGSATYPPGPDASITPYGYGGTNPWPSFEQKIYTKGNPTTCPTWNGHSAPGGFYSISAGSCSSNVVLNDWVKGTTGNSSPCSSLGSSPKAGDVIYLPVFDCMTNGPTTITPSTNCNSGTGSNTYYHVAGYAAFYVTGWYFSSDSKASIKTGVVPCSNGDRCISGWFLQDLVSAGDIAPTTPGGPPNFGLNIVKTIG